MKIRFAQEKDLEQILKLGAVFFSTTIMAQAGANFDKEGTRELLEGLIENELIVVASYDKKVVGFVLLATTPALYSFDILQGVELAFYVDPEYQSHGIGKQLILTAEEVLRNKGASILSMVCMSNSNHDVVASMYQDLGYMHTETTYSKVL